MNGDSSEPTIASEWDDFRALDVALDAPSVQLFEMRKAFYAGVASGVKLGMLRTTEINLGEMREYIAAEDRRRAAVTQSQRPGDDHGR